jgi:general secretion pathway protein A
MSYYLALGLTREPFSNSPDPDMLYRSRTHLECLQHMEIAVRLRRGLNVVLGEVGTGKTTLSRELVRLLTQDGDGDVEAHLMGDASCPSTLEFLLSLTRLFGLDTAGLGRETGLLKEALKAELLRRGQDGRRIVALIIDEGQKITPQCLELLRELLNVETNVHKLLQIVIFAQTEFEVTLRERPNLEDRVNFLYRLTPLDRRQTRRMIETRLALCHPDGTVPAVFTRLALRRIHMLTGGYPRKIVRLCHLSMLLAVGFGKRRIGWGLVGRASRDRRVGGRVWLRRLAAAGAAGGLAALVLQFAGPALPGVRQAALDSLGRMQTGLTALVSASGTPAAPKTTPAAVAEVPAPVQTPAPVQALAPAQPRPLAAAAKAPQAVAELPACEEALGLTATPAVAAAPVPASAPAAAPVAAAPALQAAGPKARTPAAPAAAPAAVAQPQASVPALPGAGRLEAPTLGRAHGGDRAASVRPPVSAEQAVAGGPAAALQTPGAPVLTPAAVPAPPAGPAATAPRTPPTAAKVAPTPATVPAAPAQGLGAALSLAAAALPPESIEQVIVVAPETVGNLPAASAAGPVVAGPAADAAIPEILGQSAVRSGWAVSRQAARIYGHARRAVMARVAQVNPGMDFNRVRAGDSIVFPAIPAAPLPQGACLIRLGRVESLEKGFAVLGRQRETDPILSLYCTLQPGAGLRFDLVLATVFHNRQEAEAALAGLPRDLAARAGVVDGYPAGTVAFTDVFLWPGYAGTPKLAAPAPAAARQVAASGLAGQDMLP